MLRFAHELAEASDATGLQRGRPFRPGRDPFQQRAGPLTLPAGEEKVSQIDRSASLRFRVRLAETERELGEICRGGGRSTEQRIARGRVHGGGRRFVPTVD